MHARIVSKHRTSPGWPIAVDRFSALGSHPSRFAFGKLASGPSFTRKETPTEEQTRGGVERLGSRMTLVIVRRTNVATNLYPEVT